MDSLFFLVLLVVVILLWRKVSSLQKRIRALEVLLPAPQRATAGPEEREAGIASSEAVGTASAGQEDTPESPAETGGPPRIAEPPGARPETGPARTAQSPGDRPDRLSPPPGPGDDRVREDRPGALPPEWAKVLENLFSGEHFLVKTGVVILFFGMAFLVKYAADHGFLPPNVRLLLAAATGLALIVLGWFLRRRRGVYSQILQGGGIGIVYLTVFAAFRLYPYLSADAAFVLLVGITVGSGVLAVLQDSRALAFLGSVGGFLAPALIRADCGSPVVLFSYLALLNACICAIAWFKAWRALNVLGFAFTFGLGSAWGVRCYAPAFFVPAELFLALFFLMFVAVAILFSLRQPPQLKGYVDGTLVFGTPVLAFALQSALVNPYPYGLAWSAAAAGLFYLLLAAVLLRKAAPALHPLVEAFLALGVLFLTLAVPLAFTERWTSAVWALEGAGILWAGIRQHRPLSRWFGVLLQVLAWLFFLGGAVDATGPTPVLNGFFLGGFLISLAAIASAYFYRRCDDLPEKSLETVFGTTLFLVGFLGWFALGIHEIDRHLPPELLQNASLVFIALSCGATGCLRKRIPWQPLLYPSMALLPAMAFLLLLGVFGDQRHPFENGGAAAWSVAFAVQYALLYGLREEASHFRQGCHAATYLLLAFLSTWEAAWAVRQVPGIGPAWWQATAAVIPSAFLFAVLSGSAGRTWPVRENRHTYAVSTAAVILGYLAGWIAFAGPAFPGDPAPLPYLPLLNPLDFAAVVSLGAAVLWYRRIDGDERRLLRLKPAALKGLLALLAFWWLNATLLRTLHFWLRIDWAPASLFCSVAVQASLSIFWTVCALSAVLWASRKRAFGAWAGGAALLGVVVVKLFLVDLSGSNTVERIVSFVVVGALLLLVGYFSPRPPKKGEP